MSGLLARRSERRKRRLAMVLSRLFVRDSVDTMSLAKEADLPWLSLAVFMRPVVSRGLFRRVHRKAGISGQRVFYVKQKDVALERLENVLLFKEA